MAENQQKEDHLGELEQEIQAWRDQAPIDDDAGSESELTRFIDDQLKEFEKLETEYQKQLARRDGDLVVLREKNGALCDELEEKRRRVLELEQENSKSVHSMSLLVSEIEIKNKGVESIIRSLFELRGVISILAEEMTERDRKIASLEDQLQSVVAQAESERGDRQKHLEALESQLRTFKDNMTALISELNDIVACNSNVSSPGEKPLPFLPLTGALDDNASILRIEQAVRVRMGNLKESIITRNATMEDNIQEIAKLKTTGDDLKSRLEAETKDVERLKSEVSNLQASLESSKKEGLDKDKSIKTLNKDLEKSRKQSEDLTGKLEKQQGISDGLSKEKGDLKTQLQVHLYHLS
ncbi:hypothetical protein BT69DRAFT_1067907 [Atractiella rhizophila]|nr:hypothetical protein BT69DRAFT_1067907 [Atractiella rhizophila]